MPCGLARSSGLSVWGLSAYTHNPHTHAQMYRSPLAQMEVTAFKRPFGLGSVCIHTQRTHARTHPLLCTYSHPPTPPKHTRHNTHALTYTHTHTHKCTAAPLPKWRSQLIRVAMRIGARMVLFGLGFVWIEERRYPKSPPSAFLREKYGTVIG